MRTLNKWQPRRRNKAWNILTVVYRWFLAPTALIPVTCSRKYKWITIKTYLKYCNKLYSYIYLYFYTYVCELASTKWLSIRICQVPVLRPGWQHYGTNSDPHAPFHLVHSQYMGLPSTACQRERRSVWTHLVFWPNLQHFPYSRKR